MAAPMRQSVLPALLRNYLRTHVKNETNKQIIPCICKHYCTIDGEPDKGKRKNSPRDSTSDKGRKRNVPRKAADVKDAEETMPVVHEITTQPKLSKASEISRAMKAYLERAQAHKTLMEAETAEFELGRRYLANMMGVDLESFGQKEVDKAIAYLFPSGLHDKKARPLMKEPIEIIPKQPEAAFDIEGRPHHYLFFTGKPFFYDLMHNFAAKLENLLEKERELRVEEKFENSLVEPLDLEESYWIPKGNLEDKLNEKLQNLDYKRFLVLASTLANHPMSYTEKDFIMQHRKMFEKQIALGTKKKEMLEDEKGRLYQIGEGKRKTAHATVKVWINGNGNVSVNGRDALYFKEVLHREQIFFPLQFTGKLGVVDVEAKVEGGGISSQAGAIRLGLSRALTSFLDDEMIKKMNLVGLLTADPRHPERKKPGQKGSRAKFTWVKR